VIGKVFYEDSEDIVRTFLRTLLEPETQLITPESVADAGAAAKATTSLRLVHMRLGRGQACVASPKTVLEGGPVADSARLSQAITTAGAQ
jgi:hypothetical protein